MALSETNLEGLPKRQGKVRDVYDLGDRLLLVATDRISAFDWVLPTGIPDKGRVLTQPERVLVRPARRAQPPDLDRRGRCRSSCPTRTREDAARAGRCWSARPRSCRSSAWSGAIWPGSGWKEYRRQGTVCGIELPAGLLESDRDRADLHPGHQGRDRATTRTSPSSVMAEVVGDRGRPRRCDREPRGLPDAARITPGRRG